MTGEFIPVEGRNVVYQLAAGEWRPAQIVCVWAIDGRKTCNLVVFVDGSNDSGHLGVSEQEKAASNPIIWRTSVYLGDLVGEYLPRKPDQKGG